MLGLPHAELVRPSERGGDLPPGRSPGRADDDSGEDGQPRLNQIAGRVIAQMVERGQIREPR